MLSLIEVERLTNLKIQVAWLESEDPIPNLDPIQREALLERNKDEIRTLDPKWIDPHPRKK